MHNYRETDEDCQGCGASAHDREAFGLRNMGTLRGLNTCPQCGTDKCCTCDMGDDVNCDNCADDQ